MVIIIYKVPTDFFSFSFLIFLYRNFYFCTEIYISVLRYTLLYCCHIFLTHVQYYGGPQRQYTNIYYITAFYILVHKHIHWLRGYIYQYNEIYTSTTILYPSTEMLISVQKHEFQNKHIHRLCD